jgi:DNA polymerase III epsilon subunit-like protein
MSRKRLPAVVFALDAESSGLYLRKPGPGQTLPSQCIALAVIALRTDTLAEVGRLNLRIRFDATRYSWSEEAAQVHGLTQAMLAAAPTMAEAATELLAFLNTHNGAGNSLFIAAHNPSFDVDALSQVLNAIGHRAKVIHRRLDAFSVGFALFGHQDSDEQFAFNGNHRTTHDAMDDIANSVDTLRTARRAGTAYRQRWLRFAVAFVAGALVALLVTAFAA